MDSHFNMFSGEIELNWALMIGLPRGSLSEKLILIGQPRDGKIRLESVLQTGRPILGGGAEGHDQRAGDPKAPIADSRPSAIDNLPHRGAEGHGGEG